MRIALMVIMIALSLVGVAKASDVAILIRHADRDGGKDALTDAGRVRSVALVEALKDRNITAIITSHLKRTKDTVAALEKATGIKSKAFFKPKDPDTKYFAGIEAAIRKEGGIVLVVGHFETIPKIVAKLAGLSANKIDMCNAAYDRMFIVNLTEKPAKFTATTYGVPTPCK